MHTPETENIPTFSRLMFYRCLPATPAAPASAAWPPSCVSSLYALTVFSQIVIGIKGFINRIHIRVSDIFNQMTGIVIAALSSVIGAVGLVVVVAAIVSNAAAASAAFAASAGGDADNPRCGHSSSTDLVSSKSMSTAAVVGSSEVVA